MFFTWIAKASNHYVEPWWLGVRLQFRVLHPSPRGFLRFSIRGCLADLAANKRYQKGLCSRVEYDSDKGKGNSNYKHGFVFWCIYTRIYYTIIICIYAAYICSDCNIVWRMLQHVAVFPGGGEEGEGSEKGEDVPSGSWRVDFQGSVPRSVT